MKVVERTGATLRSNFQVWKGAVHPLCTGSRVCAAMANSVIYENICRKCNPGAGGKKELEVVESSFPTTYVGETSRSIVERTREHWESYR